MTQERKITLGELMAIRDCLALMVDEINSIDEETDYVFTTGVGEAAEECLGIVEPLIKYKEPEEDSECERS